MPKKTKRQKILAELHRKLQTANSDLVKSQNKLAQKNLQANFILSESIHKETVTKAKTWQNEATSTYLINDLLKITIFTLFALALQGVLYFLLRTR